MDEHLYVVVTFDIKEKNFSAYESQQLVSPLEKADLGGIVQYVNDLAREHSIRVYMQGFSSYEFQNAIDVIPNALTVYHPDNRKRE